MRFLLKTITVCLFLWLCLYKQSYAQEPLIDFLSATYKSIFGETNDGLSQDGMNRLINEGESEDWKVSLTSDEAMVFTAKSPYSEVTLLSVKNKDGSLTYISYVENEKISTVDAWRKSELGIFEVKATLIPRVRTQDFFVKKKQFDEMSIHDDRVEIYLIDNELPVLVTMNLWMSGEPDLYCVGLDYGISLEWNGDAFEIVKFDNVVWDECD